MGYSPSIGHTILQKFKTILSLIGGIQPKYQSYNITKIQNNSQNNLGLSVEQEKKKRGHVEFTAVFHHALCVLHGLQQTYGNLASRAKVVMLSHRGAPLSDLCPALHCNRKRPTYHFDLLILNSLFCSKFRGRFH